MVLGILSAIDLARHVRASGEEFSYVYPEKPPEKQMRGPTPILDYLSPAIIPVDHEPVEFISTYFAVPKAHSPGRLRPI